MSSKELLTSKFEDGLSLNSVTDREFAGICKMNFEPLLPYTFFLAGTAGFWGLANLLSRNSNKTTMRLEEFRDPLSRQRRAAMEGESVLSMTYLVERAAPTLSRALEPKTENEAGELRVRLANAGFGRPNAVRNFLAIKVLALVVGLIGGVLWVSLRPGAAVGNWWTPPITVGALAFYLPEIVLRSLRSARQEKIFLQLPDALDLLVVCVEAGLGLDQGMRRVAEEMNEAAPEVSEELASANMQLQMGKPRRAVLHEMGVRTGVDDMKALVAILIQADKLGTSIGQALRVHFDTMRVKRRQLAEEKAQQTAVKMIFPLVLFIFPGIFVVLVGPAAIQLMENLLVE